MRDYELDLSISPAELREPRMQRTLEKSLRAAGLAATTRDGGSIRRTVPVSKPTIAVDVRSKLASNGAMDLVSRFRFSFAHLLHDLRTNQAVFTLELNLHGHDGSIELRYDDTDDPKALIASLVPRTATDRLKTGRWQWRSATGEWQPI